MRAGVKRLRMRLWFEAFWLVVGPGWWSPPTCDAVHKLLYIVYMIWGVNTSFILVRQGRILGRRGLPEVPKEIFESAWGNLAGDDFSGHTMRCWNAFI